MNSESLTSEVRMLINALPGIFFILSPEGLIISASNDCCILFGKKLNEIRGKSIFELLPLNSDDNNHLQNLFAKIHQKRTPEVFFSTSHICNNLFANKHFCKIELRPLINEANNVTYLLLQIEPTSLNYTKQDYSWLLDSVPDAVILIDEKEKILYFNKEAERLFGYKYEELKGESVKKIFHSADVRDALPKLQTLAGKTQPLPAIPSRIITAQKKNQKTFQADISIVPFKTEEGVIALTIIRDITEKIYETEKLQALAQQLQSYNERLEEKVRSRTEEITLGDLQYRYLFENNPMPMWIFDAVSLQFLNVNAAAISTYGYRREEFLSMRILDLLPDKEKDRFISVEHVSTYKPGSQEKTVWKHLKKDSTIITVEVIEQPLQFNRRNARLVLISDVTEKIKSEEKLIASESRFRSLIENGHDVINLLDEDFKVFYRSPSAQRITGRTDDEIFGYSALKHVHPNDLQLVKEEIKELIKSPENRKKMLFRYITKDGKTVWLEGLATNMLQDENIKAIVFNYRNVTENIVAEEKLKQSEEQYRNTLDNMIEGVQIIGFDKKYIYVNEAFAKQSGRKKEELIGRNILEVIPEMNTNRIYDIAESCLMSGKHMQIENRFILPGDTEKWYQLSIQPTSYGLFILSVDVTEKVKATVALKEEKQKLEQLAAASPGVIHSFQMDLKGNFTLLYSNDTCETIYGLSFETLKSNFSQFAKFIHPDDRDTVIRSISHSSITLSKIQLEYRYNHPEKGLLWHEVSDIPVKEPDGNITWHGVVIDVTERRKNEEKLAEQSARLQNLSNNLPGLILFQLVGKNQIERKFTYISDEVERIAGFTPAEVLNDPMVLCNRIHEDDIAKLISEDEASLKNMSVFNIETRFRDIKNEIRWLNIVSTLRKQNDNGLIIWDGFLIDITERKRSEEESRVLNERYMAVAKATSDAIWDFDFKEKKGFVLGTGYKHLFGYNIVNDYTKDGFWEDNLHPDEKEKLVKEMNAVIADKRKIKGSSEYRFRKADGSYAFIKEMFFIARDDDGNPLKLLGSKHDITAQKIADDELHKRYQENQTLSERFSAILNTLPADIALLDRKGILQDTNEAWKQVKDKANFLIYGYNKGDNYLQISQFTNTSDKKTAQNAMKGIRSVLKGKAKEFVFEYSCFSAKAGKWFRMITTQLKGQGFLGAVVMHIDITEIKKLEEEKLKSKIEEQRKITEAMVQGQEKERNAIGIELHDNVNQILVSSNMLLSMIMANPSMLNELMPKCIDNIRFAVNENRRIAHELVIPNRVTETLLQQVKRVAKTMFNDTGIKTKLLQKDFNEEILSEEQKLTVYRIVQEQCTNILKHAKATGVVFRFSMSNNQFRMRISDNGIGMKKEKIQEGIGLRNIRHRLSIVNGFAIIDSAKGKGFTLIIEMPVLAFS